jgi:division protein CdvB (Snf7/Vps24/ESCRT-III family)
MAEERIDVVVTDSVDASVEKKILGIATAAERGETYLNRLKAALASVNATAVDRLAAAMAKADNAQARLINSQARLTSAQSAGSLAAEKVALASAGQRCHQWGGAGGSAA